MKTLLALIVCFALAGTAVGHEDQPEQKQRPRVVLVPRGWLFPRYVPAVEVPTVTYVPIRPAYYCPLCRPVYLAPVVPIQ